jgi:iron complex outermembrane receptor protein
MRHGRLLGCFSLFLALSLPLAAQNISGRVTLHPESTALAGVTVSIPEWGVTAVSDAEGNYTLDTGGRTGVATLTASLQGFQARSVTVNVGTAGLTQDFDLRVMFGQEITVGSRAIGAEHEKAVPVDIIPREQIESAPSTETNQIIQKLAPSFNFPRPTISDGSDTVRPATLRGLGPDQLLVMINGKRRHASALVNANNTIGRGSSGVDLNAIPAAAIDSVEILRDGAAAQYGSDAIAGIINLVMKSGPEPLRVDLKGGATTHGDGEMYDVALSGGWSVGPGALFLVGELRDRGETNRANPDRRDQFVAGDALNNAMPQPNTHWGDSDSRDLMFFGNFNLPVTEDGKQIFYAFGGYSRREGSHGGNFRRPIDPNNWREIYPNGFLPLIEPRVDDTSLNAGVRGELASWFYDASAGYGRNKFDFHVVDSLNASLGPVNNQTEFYAGTLGDEQITLNFDLSRPFPVGNLAGPLNVAVGVEYREDSFDQEAGEVNSWIDGGHPNQFGGRATPGAQVFPGFRPENEIDVSRHSYGLYVDLEGDILERLRVGVAGRYEDFSDFGDTTNGKLTVRFTPARSVILRGAVSSGFRAPSLNQGYWSAISTNFIVNPANGQVEPFQVGTFRVNAPIARALGARDLEPEKSRNLSAGVVWQPLANLEFTADFFHIEIDDRIVYTGNFNQPALQPIISPFGVGGVRFLTNAINTETDGLDLVVNHQRPLLGGRVDLSAAYSRNETEIVGAIATPPQLAAFSQVLFDRQEQRRFECGQPKDNIRLLQNWTGSAWGVTLRESRYGEYCSLTINPLDDQTYEAEWVMDAEISYRFSRYTFAVGADNLTDAFPDENFLFRPGTTNVLAQQSGTGGTNSYPINAPFGMNGRFVYSRVTYRF